MHSWNVGHPSFATKEAWKSGVGLDGTREKGGLMPTHDFVSYLECTAVFFWLFNFKMNFFPIIGHLSIVSDRKIGKKFILKLNS